MASRTDADTTTHRPRVPLRRVLRGAVELADRGGLGARTDEVLHRPRDVLAPPWAKDHRLALAATIVAGAYRPDI